MTTINGLTNPFENSILNMNLTQLEKDQQLANYSDAIAQGYEPPVSVLDEITALLASGVLSTEAQARLQELIDLIIAEFAPLITLDDGGDTAQVSVDENTFVVTTVTALDQYSLNDGTEALSYSIVGGADSTLFQIGATTGVLTFYDAPDFEAPGDAGGDNVYDVDVQVNDGALLLDTQAIQVTVADVFEGPPLPTNFGAVMNGIDADDRSGWSVSSAGDVNGDGFDDMLIGAYNADPNGNRSGQTYLVYGAATGIPANLNLSDLDGSNGFVMNGIDFVDASGWSVSSAGDVNNDGFDDMLIGAYEADPNVDRSGETYLVYGAATDPDSPSPSLDLSTLNGSNGFVMNGIDIGDNSGFSVSSAGDVNNDGFDDMLIGARFASLNADANGETYLVYGAATDPDSPSPSLDLSTLNGSNGFVMNGIGHHDFSGWSVSSAGDVNDDGYDDMLIGAPGGTGSGETYLVYGAATDPDSPSPSLDLSTLNGTNDTNGTNANGFVFKGIGASDSNGFSVSSAGDVNGDGIADILIGAYRASPNGIFSGETYLIYGGDTNLDAFDLADGDKDGSIDLSTLNGTNGSNGFVMNGIDFLDLSGISVSSAGDVNGDGYDDILIGANGADPNSSSSGETYLVFGAASGIIPASLDLSTLNGTNDTNGTNANGFVFKGIAASDISGRSVSSAGDVNGDGYADILIGAAGADPNGSSSGETYLIYGGKTILDAFDLADGFQDGSIELSHVTDAFLI